MVSFPVVGLGLYVPVRTTNLYSIILKLIKVLVFFFKFHCYAKQSRTFAKNKLESFCRETLDIFCFFPGRGVGYLIPNSSFFYECLLTTSSFMHRVTEIRFLFVKFHLFKLTLFQKQQFCRRLDITKNLNVLYSFYYFGFF